MANRDILLVDFDVRVGVTSAVFIDELGPLISITSAMVVNTSVPAPSPIFKRVPKLDIALLIFYKFIIPNFTAALLAVTLINPPESAQPGVFIGPKIKWTSAAIACVVIVPSRPLPSGWLVIVTV